MKKHILAITAAALTLSSVNIAYADGARRNAYENAAGGVTAGGQRAVSGPWGGRAAGEGGVITNGRGAGIGGSRGCAEGAAGGWGCRRGVTARDEDGKFVHRDSGYAEGPLGNTASTSGSWTRDEDGDVIGDRSSEATIGDRTYSAESSYDSDDGFDRDVTCSGDC
jgi:hypothetical protein